MTFIMDDHHYYAWCRECPYTGPLRFSRALAAEDAARHLEERHAGDASQLESVTIDPEAG